MRLTYAEVLELAESGAYGGERELSPATCALLLCALPTFLENVWNWTDGKDNWDAIQAMVSAATNEVMYGVIGNGNGFEDMSIAIIADQKVSGVDGGSFTQGAWRVRDLNTEIADPDSIVAVADNGFTLPAGTFLIFGSAPAYKTSYHQARIYDVTGDEEVEVGTSETSNASDNSVTRSFVAAVVVLTGATEFELQHRCLATRATNGYGKATSWGVEQYSRVLIMRLE